MFCETFWKQMYCVYTHRTLQKIKNKVSPLFIFNQKMLYCKKKRKLLLFLEPALYNISVSLRSVLLIKEAEVLRETLRPTMSHL
jgi:hypothetical protein